MPSVEDRIVRIEFDNSAFERKIGATLQSLQRLNDSLKFQDAARGFADITAGADRVNFGGLTGGIESVSAKFIALSTIAITILSNIVDRAFDAGVRIARSLSLDSVLGGFHEYELGMGSIQTILANTRVDGTSLEQVNAALEELNHYADQTIYNFGQMTRNIGTFTAAGVDLDTSVQSIKGIANLAAISGSTSEQASSAMYQLSQAISTGTLRLIDWNSVVNAGMGGEVFQRALFTTGQAMGTITNTRVGQTFDEWTAAGNTFRGSLEDNWLTAEVLTQTLQNFTGDVTEEQLRMIGYTEEQIAGIVEMGQVGVEAATKVRTLTQLIDTTKEALQSGWSGTFRAIFGDFEQATELFTSISDAISGMIGESAEARNEMFHLWAWFGGRDQLIEALSDAFNILGRVIFYVKDAFRDVFPPMTAVTLQELTDRFSDFIDRLQPSTRTLVQIGNIFRGIFSTLQTGWVIIRETARFFLELFQSATGAGEGNFLEFLSNIGNFLTDLNERLVAGGGIVRFFERLREVIRDPIGALEDLRDNILGFFEDFDINQIDAFDGIIQRLGDRFGFLGTILENLPDLWAPFAGAMDRVRDITDEIWDHLSTWFSELGDKLAQEFSEEDFDPATDIIAVGLLGGIALALRRFIDNFSLNELNGLLGNIGGAFEELTGVLSAMQAQLRANALLRIATAIGILTASVVVLSLIDSEALTRALTAMAVGFGQLLGAFAILTRIQTGLGGAASVVSLAAGMILISTAILILSGAAATMANLDWEEIARGLTGVTGLLGALTASVVVMSGNTGGMVRAGVGIIAIATGMLILVQAVEGFAGMDWEEMGQGLAGVAGGLVLIVGAMQLMPPGLFTQGLGLIFVATGLNLLALAVRQFAGMTWEEMGRGAAALAGGLGLIAAAMHAMPPGMIFTAAGLVLVGMALGDIAEALGIFGDMSWDEIGRGLAAMAGALGAITLAMNFMSSTVMGAVSLIIVAHGLRVLAEVLEQLGNLSWGELLRGLAAIASVLTVLGVAAYFMAPIVPALLGIGAAMLLLGGGFALAGVAALQFARAMEIISRIDPQALLNALMAVAAALPALVEGFLVGVANGIGGVILAILELAPDLARAFGVLVGHVLDSLIDLVPRAARLISELIGALLGIIRERFPDWVQTGIEMILALLTGIRDNIEEVVTLVGDILVEFLNAMEEQVPRVVRELVETFVAIFQAVAYEVGAAIPALTVGLALSFFSGFWAGLEQELPGLTSFFEGFPGSILGWIGDVASTLWNKGVDLITGIIGGIVEKVVEVTTFFTNLPIDILNWIGDVARTLWDKGTQLLQGLKDGIDDKMRSVTSFFQGLGEAVVSAVGSLLSTLYDKGEDILQGFLDGIEYVFDTFVTFFFEHLPDNIIDFFGNPLDILLDVGRDIIQGLWDGIREIWDRMTGWISDAVGRLPGPIRDILGSNSPSMVFMDIGRDVMLGLEIGLHDGAPAIYQDIRATGEEMSNQFSGIISDITRTLGEYEEFSPTITPVLDLSQVQRDAARIPGYIPDIGAITPTTSYAQAQSIASTRTPINDEELATVGAGNTIFNQTINAPEPLSTADIYRQTRNQLTLAKGERGIP